MSWSISIYRNICRYISPSWCRFLRLISAQDFTLTEEKNHICITLWMHCASLDMDGINWHLQVQSSRNDSCQRIDTSRTNLVCFTPIFE